MDAVPLTSCDSSLAITAVDGRLLGDGNITYRTLQLSVQTGSLHKERMEFLIRKSPQHTNILGWPWLQAHNPLISWKSGEISKWSESCLKNCLCSVVPVQFNAIVASTETPEKSLIPDEYKDLAEAFSKQKATKHPPYREYDCAIELLPGTTPPPGRIFPLSQTETETMNACIKEELEKGFIRPSTLPASAGFFFVEKKDGSLHPCNDYRGLNEITVKYRYPLPLVPTALEQLCSARYFTKLDLRSADNLIRIKRGDEWKTGFSTATGHYEYRVIRHVRAVLQRLMENQLYAKLSKCEFHQTCISFLGYIISADGVAMDEEKVNAVVNWPKPKTVKQLQRFLGFANFYRRFIRNFSSMTAPLTSMMKGGNPVPLCIEWP